MPDPQPLSYESTQASWNGIGIGTIALQLLGVYCMALALPMLSSVATHAAVIGGAIPPLQLLYALVPLAVYVGLGVLLIRFAPRVSVWLFRDTAVGGVMGGPVTAPAGQYLQAVAFSVVGVVLVVSGAPLLASLAWSALVGQFGIASAMIHPAAQVLFGVALFLQSKGLARLWHNLRTGGVIAPPPPDARGVQPPDAVHSRSESA